MYRQINEKLKHWLDSNSPNPVIIYGARQVGKTYTALEFGKDNFLTTAYLNFEGNTRLKNIFHPDLDTNRIIKELSIFLGFNINENTLIIFDEIQSCTKALTSLKYFSEDKNNYKIIATGSLLGLETASFPVGKVNILKMFPLNFEEFLFAMHEDMLIQDIKSCYNNNASMNEILHEKAFSLFYLYLVVGGMPAAIIEYLNTNNFNYIVKVQNDIYNSYTSDIAKYSDNKTTLKTNAVFESIPYQLAKENKKFQYNLIKSGARASAYEDSLTWLIKMGIVLPSYLAKEGKIPLEYYKNSLSYKIYMSDVGLLCAKSNIPSKLILSNLNIAGEAKGALIENYLAMQLASKEYNLYYWTSGQSAELDFILQLDDKITPLETKSAINTKAKSFDLFMKKYNLDYGIKACGKNFGFENNIKTIPLYAVFCI